MRLQRDGSLRMLAPPNKPQETYVAVFGDGVVLGFAEKGARFELQRALDLATTAVYNVPALSDDWRHCFAIASSERVRCLGFYAEANNDTTHIHTLRRLCVYVCLWLDGMYGSRLIAASQVFLLVARAGVEKMEWVNALKAATLTATQRGPSKYAETALLDEAFLALRTEARFTFAGPRGERLLLLDEMSVHEIVCVLPRTQA